jgi:hypothetical protein
MPRRKKIDVVTQADILDEIERRVDGQELLTEAEKAEIKAQAKAQVEEQRKDRAVKSLLEAYKKAEENRFDPAEKLVDWTCELGDFAPCITVNGRMQYYHGVTYRLPVSVVASLNDIAWQTQCHQREIDGKRRHGDILRQPLNQVISPTNPGRVTGRGNLRI